MLIDMAVELEIPDNNRRKAIQEITGIDIDNMIKLKEQTVMTQEDEEQVRQRRVSTSTPKTGRRVAH